MLFEGSEGRDDLYDTNIRSTTSNAGNSFTNYKCIHRWSGRGKSTADGEEESGNEQDLLVVECTEQLSPVEL